MITKVYKEFNTTSAYNKTVTVEFSQPCTGGDLVIRLVDTDHNYINGLAGGSSLSLKYTNGFTQVTLNTAGGDKQLENVIRLQDDIKAYFELEPQILSALPSAKKQLEED